MIGRIWGVIRLNARTFEDVENDTSATVQAIGVIVLASLATGAGAGFGFGSSIIGDNFAISLISGVVIGLAWWSIWTCLIMLIGAAILGGPEIRADWWWRLVRVIGFAQAPGLVKMLSFLPWIGGAVFFVVSAWQVVATVIAVRQCYHVSTWPAVGVVLLAFVVTAVLVLVILVVVLIAMFVIGVALVCPGPSCPRLF